MYGTRRRDDSAESVFVDLVADLRLRVEIWELNHVADFEVWEWSIEMINDANNKPRIFSNKSRHNLHYLLPKIRSRSKPRLVHWLEYTAGWMVSLLFGYLTITLPTNCQRLTHLYTCSPAKAMSLIQCHTTSIRLAGQIRGTAHRASWAKLHPTNHPLIYPVLYHHPLLTPC